MTSALRQFRHAIEARGLLRGVRCVLVAVSGGADSVALAHLMAHLAAHRRLRIAIAHLHHGLRGPRADRDARFVQELAWTLGCPCWVGRADVGGRDRRAGESLEMAGRRERRAFLARTAARCGADAIALAHTRSDQAETVLMRLARGAGGRGLGGMAHDTVRDGARVIRPLLDLERADLEAFLRAHRLAWREDETNRDLSITRNRVRHQILPWLEARLNPRIRSALVRTAEILREEDAWLRAETRRRLRRGRVGAAGVLECARLRRLPRPLRRRALVEWLHASGVEGETVDFDAVERIDALLAGPSAGSRFVPVGGGWRAVRVYGRLRLERGPAPRPPAPAAVTLRPPGEVRLPALGVSVHFRLLRVARPPARGEAVRALVCRRHLGQRAFIVRTLRPGDRIRPLGMAGSRKVRDVLMERHVPAADRGRVPLVACGDEVVWFPGARIAEGWQIPSDGGPAIEILVQPLREARDTPSRKV